MNFYQFIGLAAAFAAAFCAGAVNAIAGGGTLLTFPLLLWLGLDSKTANATSTVALYPGLFGGLFGYRHEMKDSRTALIRLGVPSLIGGAFGAWLLVKTPTLTFDMLVPFLILFATLLFMAQESINRILNLGDIEQQRSTVWWAGALALQFCSAIYGGYFGAGNGILMLAILSVLGFSNIHRANGIKNFMAICLNTVAVMLFSVSGMVRWREASVMAVGAIAGGYLGANVARRLGKTFVRRAVVCVGLTMAALMLWRLAGKG